MPGPSGLPCGDVQPWPLWLWQPVPGRVGPLLAARRFERKARGWGWQGGGGVTVRAAERCGAQPVGAK